MLDQGGCGYNNFEYVSVARLSWRGWVRETEVLRVKQKEVILRYLYKIKMCSLRYQLIAAKLLLSKVYRHYCQSSGSADLALLSTASQVVESKIHKGKIPLWHWHRCLKVSTTSKAKSSGFNFTMMLYTIFYLYIADGKLTKQRRSAAEAW